MTPSLPPDLALSRAQACLAAGDGAQALVIMRAAVARAPDHAALQVALGVALRFAGQLAPAAQAFSRALALQPGRADAQVYLGMIRLAQGRQQEGWPLYQARWRAAHWPEKLRYPENFLWQGEVTGGMRLLLWSEQGFGDAIQFARYAPWLLRLLVRQGATLVLEVQAELLGLLRAAWPFIDIVACGAHRGHFDVHLPLMDLPGRWGNLVGAGGLPWQPMPAPYLSALPDLLAAHRGAVPLPTGRKALRVGIVWQGRPTHPDDRWRSIHPDQLDALFAVPGICWVSLQKEGAQGAQGGRHPAWLPDEMAHCADFSDTARIVDGLDLVISIDSALAHLAGALGRPVWLLLPVVADWRWQLEGDDTPWYSTLRLFRQGGDESWSDVTRRVAASLSALMESGNHDWPLLHPASGGFRPGKLA